MLENSEKRERFPFLEGTRGIAALIVVLTHYASAFLPVFARVAPVNPHWKWEITLTHTPLFVFVNGGVAVIMFFIMSGFVLTASFVNSDLSFIRQVAKRTIRLYLPVAISVLLASALLVNFPLAKISAASLTQSDWLVSLCKTPLTLASVAKDLLQSSMFFGYQGASIFDNIWVVGRMLSLAPVTEAANTPLWTLHYEFWGSLLVLLTSIAYRMIPGMIFWITFAVVAVITSAGYSPLFLLGFAAYIKRDFFLRSSGTVGSVIGFAALGCAIVLDYATPSTWLRDTLLDTQKLVPISLPSSGLLQSEGAGVLFLLAIAITPTIRTWFSRPSMLALGRVSFSLYLVHFPILFTVACEIFNLLVQHFSYSESIAGSAVLSAVVTAVAAVIFEKLVDQPAVSLSRIATAFPDRKTSRSSRQS